MSSWLDAIKTYFEIRNRSWVNLDTREFLQQVCPSKDVKWYKYVRHLTLRKNQALQLQGKRLLRIHSAMRVHDAVETEDERIRVHVEETIYWVYQDKDKFAVESRVIVHRQEWVAKRGNWVLIMDEESNEKEKYTENVHDYGESSIPASLTLKMPESDRTISQYDRVKAIRYAELWWNGYNSIYPALDDDCTNFISQCLHAGKLGMTRPTNRATGWWYRFDSSEGSEPWSYSWTVSHVLYQHLTRNVGATRVSAAKELKMGDLVLYDWDGSGRYHHTAIVTDFDEYGDPLVNAHSDSSLHRPYTYFDSRAWSKRTRYAFIHIPDNLGATKRDEKNSYAEYGTLASG